KPRARTSKLCRLTPAAPSCFETHRSVMESLEACVCAGCNAPQHEGKSDLSVLIPRSAPGYSAQQTRAGARVSKDEDRVGVGGGRRSENRFAIASEID